MDFANHLVIISTIIFILLIWFKTDALAEYGNLLRIKFFVKFFQDRDARPELTLLTYLGINNRTSFIIKILLLFNLLKIFNSFDGQTIKKINPECHNEQSHYISAQGYYMPCCFTGDHRFYYKTEFGLNRKQYSIEDTTLSEILNRTQVAEFYDTLVNQSVCQYNCGE